MSGWCDRWRRYRHHQDQRRVDLRRDIRATLGAAWPVAGGRVLRSAPMSAPRPFVPLRRQADARAIGRRTHQTFLFAGVTGVLVGLAVIALERVTAEALLEPLADRPLWLQAVAPGVGLVIAYVCLRWIADRRSPATTDEYIRSFHDDGHEPPSARPVLGRVLASVATIGYGGGGRPGSYPAGGGQPAVRLARP